MSTYEKVSVLLSCVQLMTVVVGFYYAQRQLRLLQLDVHNSVELAARQQAMDLIARYSAPEAAERRHRLRVSLDAQRDYHECCALLNSLEEVSIAHKHSTANRSILKDAFATAVRGWLDKEFMLDALAKARDKDSARFENLISLYYSWGGNSPRLAAIKQIRPLETE